MVLPFPWRVLRPNPPFLKAPLPSNVKDPWARRDSWRHHPFFHTNNMAKETFPGLGIAIVAFATYCGLEAAGVIGSDDHATHHE